MDTVHKDSDIYSSLIFGSIPCATLLVDDSGHISQANVYADHLFGYSHGELTGMDFKCLIPEQLINSPGVFCINYKHTSGTQLMGANRVSFGLRKDGSEVPVEINLGPFSANGVQYDIVIIRDITECRRTEAALLESEQRFRMVADDAPMLIWMSGIDKRCNYFNKAWLDFTGRTLKEELGDGWAENVHPDDRQYCMETYITAFDAHNKFEMTYRLRHSSGEYRWIFDKGAPRWSANGEFIGYVGSCIDITGQKQVEISLRENEKIFEHAQTLAHMGSWTADLTTGTFFPSPEGARIVGWPNSTMSTRDLFLVIHPADKKKVISTWNDSLLTGNHYEIEHRVIVEGQVKWLHVKAEIAYDTERHPLMAIGMLLDITEIRETRAALEIHKKRLEDLVSSRTAALRQQTNYLRALIDNFPILVWLKDTNSRYLAVNQMTANESGQNVEALLGKTDFDVWPRHIAEYIHADDIDVIHSRRQKTVERMISTMDGNGSRWMEIYSAPVMDDDGTVLGTVGFARDISERKSAERAQHIALAEAEHLAQVRSVFLANMSHEIRTPLNAILGLAKIGMRQNAGRATQDTYTHIVDTGEHLLKIINDILDFSKIESDKLSIETVPFALGEVIDRTVNLMSAGAYAKDVTLHIDEAFNLPMSCRGDPQRLSQILLNLLSNAIKFTASGGQVVFSIRVDGDKLVFRVSDTGIGMNPKQLARLFQPFEQADGSTTREFGGTGLGLVICKRLVELMKGEIRVESCLGVGSIFEVRLPLVDAKYDTINAPLTQLALIGFSVQEASMLIPKLQLYGLEGFTATLDFAMCTTAPWVVLASILVEEQNRKAVKDALDRDQRVVIVVTPGKDEVPAELMNRVYLIDRPIWARRLLDTLTAPLAKKTVTQIPANRLKGYTILAVEDNAANRLVLSDLLSYEGAQLFCVESGGAAIDLLYCQGTDTYNIVLMDIQMPGMDGYETTQRIHRFAPNLPIVGLTAHAMPEERVRCLAAGMLEHVVKPFDIDQLVRVIRQFGRQPNVDAIVPVESSEILTEGVAITKQSEPVGVWSDLEKYFPGRRAFLIELVTTILQSNNETITELRELAKHGEFQRLAELSHSLKGISGMLKAHDVKDLAVQVEQHARESNPDILTLTEQLAQTVEEWFEALTVYKNSAVAVGNAIDITKNAILHPEKLNLDH